MDIKDVLRLTGADYESSLDLTGWLVDTKDGLYLLGDHFPEDFNFPERIRIADGNIMYLIRKKISCLGGGYSLLFYRAKVKGRAVYGAPVTLAVQELYVESLRESGEYEQILIDSVEIEKCVRAFGDYKFRQQSISGDWLDSVS